MIYINCALYAEASPFITFFNLKKDMSEKIFQVFKNNEVMLTITKPGAVKAACACAYVFGKYGYSESDNFFNIGICGAQNDSLKTGDVIYADKIGSELNKRTFYPEMIFKNNFIEGSLFSSCRVETKKTNDFDAVDMEGASSFEAASMFLPLHRIHILKIVSDHLSDSKVLTKNDVTDIVNSDVEKIFSFIKSVSSFKILKEKILNDDENKVALCIAKNINMTKAMESKFNMLCEKYKIRHGEISSILEKYLSLKSEIKSEGKRYFAQITAELVK